MSVASRALAALRFALRPFAALLNGDEPAIAAALVAVGVNLAAHYQFHLSATLQTYFAVAVAALVHWVVRQSVYPASRVEPMPTARRPKGRERPAKAARR